jgi:hypothetical protein
MKHIPDNVLRRRIEIAADYIQSVAVIDDQLYEVEEDQTKGRRLSELGEPIFSTSEREGILCHLHGYPARLDFGADDERAKPLIESASKLAGRSNMVVLDWFLGQEGSFSHSLAVLDSLSKLSGIRYVLIYTQDGQEVNIQDELIRYFDTDIRSFELASENVATVIESPKEERDGTDGQPDASAESLSTRLEETEPTETGTEQFEEGPGEEPSKRGFLIRNHVFVTIGKKGPISPESLITTLPHLFSQLYPDSLHWAALELSNHARTNILQLLSQLPNNTECALRTQLFYQRKDEVAAQVAEILVDEFMTLLTLEPLTMVTNEALVDFFYEELSSAAHDDAKWKDVTDRINLHYNSQFKVLRSKWVGLTKEEFLARLNDASTEDNKQFFDNLFPGKPDAEKFGNTSRVLALGAYVGWPGDASKLTLSHSTWAALRESKAIDLGSLTGEGVQSLRPGLVLVRAKDLTPAAVVQVGEAVPEVQDLEAPRRGEEWYLCVSAACDCYRPNNRALMFLAGREVSSNLNESSSNALTEVFVWQEGLRVIKTLRWDFSRVRTFQWEEIEMSGVVGALRDPVIARIIQRLWSYQSRVGVDTSELFRSYRKLD